MKSTILIEKYLDGTLKGDKLKNFEEKMNSSNELRELVTVHKEVNECIGHEDDTELRKKLGLVYSQFRKWENNEEKDTVIGLKQQKKAEIFVKHRLLIAASISLLVIVGALILYILKAKGYTSDELFSMYYKPYINDINIRSDSHKLGDMESAILLYNNYNYQQANDKFRLIVDKSDENYMAQFYYGLTCIETGEIDMAIQQLENILENWESPFIYHAEWYLLLCYVKSNNNEKALELIQSIKYSNSYYKGGIEEILQKIN